MTPTPSSRAFRAGADYDEDEDVEWKDDWNEGELREVINNAGANDNRLYKFCPAPASRS